MADDKTDTLPRAPRPRLRPANACSMDVRRAPAYIPPLDLSGRRTPSGAVARFLEAQAFDLVARICAVKHARRIIF